MFFDDGQRLTAIGVIVMAKDAVESGQCCRF